MNIRSLVEAALPVEMPNGIHDALVSNAPNQYPPADLIGRIVIMPERCLVHLVRFKVPDDERLSEKKAIDRLAATLCQEVIRECISGTECGAQKEEYQAEVPEINGEVLATGVICPKVASGRCPAGIRSEL